MKGPDNNLWFTENNGFNIGRITTGCVVTEFALPNGGNPSDITVGPDGNLWFTDSINNAIGRITPSGTITEFPVPTSFANLVGITTGPDNALWFVEQGRNKIGRYLPSPATTLVAAVLPGSRSVQVGATATAFAVIINSGSAAATSCSISPSIRLVGTFSYQTTDPSTNALTGSPNTPVNIQAGQSQTFVFAFKPTQALDPTDVSFNFTCTNTNPSPLFFGIDTLLLSASISPVPDLVALAASGDPGIVDIPGATGTGVFAVASVNVGVSGSITVTADTGQTFLPISIALCQTNPTTGVCLSTPSSSVTTTINAYATPTFGIFVTGNSIVPFDPAANRIFVRFSDSGGVVRGATSVAVRTQ